MHLRIRIHAARATGTQEIESERYRDRDVDCSTYLFRVCACAKKYGWLASLLPCAMPVATVGCSIDIRDYVTGMGNLSRDPHYGRTICAYVDSFGWLLDKDGGEERLETVYLQFHCLSKGNPYMFRIESVHCLQRSKIDC